MKDEDHNCYYTFINHLPSSLTQDCQSAFVVVALELPTVTITDLSFERNESVAVVSRIITQSFDAQNSSNSFNFLIQPKLSA